jgi:flagellar basal body rod protein FlgG
VNSRSSSLQTTTFSPLSVHPCLLLRETWFLRQGTAMVQQGQLELANTSAIDEMLTLIECSRHLDAAQKALQTIAESVQKRIGLR